MFDKKKVLRSVSLGMSTVVLVGAGLLSGCSPAPADNGTGGAGNVTPSPSPTVQENKNDKIMPGFMALLGEKTKPAVLIEYMDKNIAAVSKEDASRMLMELEKAQQNYQKTLEEKYYAANIQESLGKIFSKDMSLDKINDTQDPALKKLLEETGSMGYKVETAEGMFFPIQDYGYLKKFSPYAGDDIKAYIDIMAVESEKVPAKDAALVISWDEVLERAFSQEAYIEKYSSSPKLDSVKELYSKYRTFILFGLNNTPLFAYEDKAMDKEARAAFEKAAKGNDGSGLGQLLGSYMKVIEKNGYKLTDEVDNFRKKIDDKK
ncbi:MAG: hypothetical protein ACM3ZR_03290 [Pseudomonadota bacterium]